MMETLNERDLKGMFNDVNKKQTKKDMKSPKNVKLPAVTKGTANFSATVTSNNL